jgi:FAD:protein FMN transferase
MRVWRLSIFTLLGVMAFLAFSCSRGDRPELHKLGRFAMGTLVEVTLRGTSQETREASQAVFEELKRLEDLTSFHKPSALTAVNDNAGKKPVHADRELFSMIREALRVAKATNGAFDPTVGALTRLWQFSGGQDPRLPEQKEIDEALTRVGWQKVQLDTAAGTIFLPEQGMALDLGGLVKGVALNRAAQIVKDKGIASALINIGGDIVAVGEKTPGKPWRVGVKDPRNEGGIVAVAPLADKVIVTSGDYERFFVRDGRRYHHILNPRTGYPAEGSQSVTIVGPIGVTLQPFGTAAFVTGPVEGLKLFKSVPGTEGFTIDSTGMLHLSPGAKALFETTRKNSEAL